MIKAPDHGPEFETFVRDCTMFTARDYRDESQAAWEECSRQLGYKITRHNSQDEFHFAHMQLLLRCVYSTPQLRQALTLAASLALAPFRAGGQPPKSP